MENHSENDKSKPLIDSTKPTIGKSKPLNAWKQDELINNNLEKVCPKENKKKKKTKTCRGKKLVAVNLNLIKYIRLMSP